MFCKTDSNNTYLSINKIIILYFENSKPVSTRLAEHPPFLASTSDLLEAVDEAGGGNEEVVDRAAALEAVPSLSVPN
jgi:hypothetical protein